MMLPVFDRENSTTRDKIISILADESNLNTKKLNAILKKQYTLNVTYQAIHKTLKQMVEQEILIFDGKSYNLNSKWIDELKRFVGHFERNINQPKTTVRHHKISPMLETIEMDNLHEIEKLFFEFREDYFNNIEKYPKDKRITCYHAPHAYVALMSPTNEFEFMSKLLEHKAKHYTLVKGNTLVDAWIETFYNTKKGHPYFMKTNANCSSLSEVWIYPDKIVEVFFSEKFWKFFDNVYKGISKIQDINYNTIIERLYTLKSEPGKAIIHKDPSIIKLAYDETLSQFEQKVD